MTSDSDILCRTDEWFQKAIPSPTAKNFQVQVGVHCEEVAEMLETFDTDEPTAKLLLSLAYEAIKQLGEHLKSSPPSLRVSNPMECLDALCDQLVTATGIGHMADYDVPLALAEVNESNFSKFVNGEPVFDANMKVMKGPNYFKPDLRAYLPAQESVGG